MKSQFDKVVVGGEFIWAGRRFVKLALSMAEDESRTGSILLAETEVEVEIVDGRESVSGGAIAGSITAT